MSRKQFVNCAFLFIYCMCVQIKIRNDLLFLSSIKIEKLSFIQLERDTYFNSRIRDPLLKEKRNGKAKCGLFQMVHFRFRVFDIRYLWVDVSRAMLPRRLQILRMLLRKDRLEHVECFFAQASVNRSSVYYKLPNAFTVIFLLKSFPQEQRIFTEQHLDN